MSHLVEDYRNFARFGYPLPMREEEPNSALALTNDAVASYGQQPEHFQCDGPEERTPLPDEAPLTTNASSDPHQRNSKRLRLPACRPENGTPCVLGDICSQKGYGDQSIANPELPCEHYDPNNGSMAIDFSGVGNVSPRTVLPLQAQSKRSMSNSTIDSVNTEEEAPNTGIKTHQSVKRPAQNPHSQVERKYRESLALRFDKLRKNLPSLNSEQDADVEDLPGPSKVSKAEILNSAIDYVRQSEKAKKAMADELDVLRTRVKMLEKLVKCEDCWLMNGFGSVPVDKPPYQDNVWMQGTPQL
ncbi:MAG: hypothetical protein MMC33_000703 [Icmadophila ericetorum]|nr:hypothetical protein [Icmadophila ericetorum]